MLTPETDGNYYHTVHSGETLSWIAGWYAVSLADLMAWNGLNNASVIRPEQKLVLRVTPPATETPTPSPATITPSPSPSITPSPMTATPAVSESSIPPTNRVGGGVLFIVLIIAIGGALWWRVSHKA